MNPARVVFDIKLENGIQKVVTVKSALVLKNKTDIPLEVKLDLSKCMLPTASFNISFYNIAFVNSERWLAKGRVDITLCQHGNFPAALFVFSNFHYIYIS